MKTKRYGWIALAMLAATAVSNPAAADGGLLLQPAMLQSDVRTQLAAEIASARTLHPEAFRTVSEIARGADTLDKGRRGRYFPFSRPFRALGAKGVMPLVELVAFEGPVRGALSDTAWDALRAGALQALGESRDGRARPVIEAVLMGPESNFLVMRNAAAALAQFGDDAAASTLIALASAPSAKREAIVAGMGECRRATIAEFLAAELARRPEGEHAKNVLEAMSDAGNAWAWQTSQVREHASEELGVRATATQALLDAFVHYDGYLRGQAKKALFVVNHPETVALAEALKAQHAANPTLVKDLAKLQQMIAEHPID